MPFTYLFYELCSLIAPLYFDQGDKVLESACDNICNWPKLLAGETISLHILGTVFQSYIPTILNNTKINQQIATTHQLDDEKYVKDPDLNEFLKIRPMQMPPQVLSSLHEIDIFRSLFSVLSHIHLLWELVLTAEPIVVMGASPTDCSMMVQSLTRYMV